MVTGGSHPRRGPVMSLSYRPGMPTLLRLLQSLGPAGAVANAAELLDERRREDRLVAELTGRVGVRERPPVTVAA